MREEAYKLKNLYDQVSGSLAREKEEHSQNKSRLEKELQNRQEEIQRLESTIAENRADYDRASNEAAAQIQEKDQNIQELNSTLKNRDDRIHNLEIQRNQLSGEIDSLKQSIASAEKQHQDQVLQLEAERDSIRNELERNIRNLEQELQKTSADLDQTRQELRITTQERNRLNQEKHDLEIEVSARKQTIQEKTAEIQSLNQLIEDLKKESSKLENLIAEKNQSIREGHQSEERLRKEIGARKEQEARLTRDIRNLDSEIVELKAEIQSKENNIGKLSQQEAQLRDTLNQRQRDLDNARNRESQLKDDLDKALTREKNSREAGYLLASAARSLSESQTFEDKLSTVDKQVFANYKLQRLSVFTLLEDDLLERFYSRNVPEFPVRASIPLASTFFGEALATHRPSILKKKSDAWPYDLPELEIADNQEFYNAERDDQDPQASLIKKIKKGKKTEEVYVLLPLVEGDRTRGLLVATFPAKTEISDADQKLLESLIPFVSTSFQYEKNRSHLLVAQRNIRISDDIQDFLHHRYLESSRGIYRLFVGFNSGEVRTNSIFDPLRQEIHEAEKLADGTYLNRHFPIIDYSEKVNLMRKLYETLRASQQYNSMPEYWKNILNRRSDNWQPLEPENIPGILSTVSALRDVPEYYLRNITICIVQGIVRMQFNCDGTQIIDAHNFKQFLEDNLP